MKKAEVFLLNKYQWLTTQASDSVGRKQWQHVWLELMKW